MIAPVHDDEDVLFFDFGQKEYGSGIAALAFHLLSGRAYSRGPFYRARFNLVIRASPY